MAIQTVHKANKLRVIVGDIAKRHAWRMRRSLDKVARGIPEESPKYGAAQERDSKYNHPVGILKVGIFPQGLGQDKNHAKKTKVNVSFGTIYKPRDFKSGKSLTKNQ